jgi:hypothetical protein
MNAAGAVSLAAAAAGEGCPGLAARPLARRAEALALAGAAVDDLRGI